MSEPRVMDMAALVRVGRYLVHRPRVVYQMPWRGDAGIEAFVDSDFAGCPETRKSTSGGCLVIGGHLIKHWASTQKTLSLSSGESELSGILKGTSEALGLRSLA